MNYSKDGVFSFKEKARNYKKSGFSEGISFMGFYLVA
jgi:hypothetical protein